MYNQFEDENNVNNENKELNEDIEQNVCNDEVPGNISSASVDKDSENAWHTDDYQRDAIEGNILPTYSQPSLKPQKKKKKILGYVAAVVATIFLTTGICLAVTIPMINSVSHNQQYNGYPLSSSKSANFEQLTKSDGSQLSVVDIAKKIGPAVVGIESQQESYSIFGKQTGTGSGSGIIIRNDGYIITNQHVIDNGQNLTVIMNNGKEYPAKVIGQDITTDLAVIKIDASGLPTAELGSSSELEVGELAVAIGNPLGQEFAGSVTVGVISALNRSVTVGNRTFSLIQTDAAINPGNSGGALVNSYGQVIGINSVKVESAEGLGFAIPIDAAKPIVDELIANGYVTGRPMIGISPRDITPEMSRQYDIPEGVYVVQVSPFSGAEKAGIQQGDVIVEANGQEVKTLEDLNNIKNKLKAGDSMPVTIKRGTKGSNNWDTIKINVVLDEDKPAQSSQAQQAR